VSLADDYFLATPAPAPPPAPAAAPPGRLSLRWVLALLLIAVSGLAAAVAHARAQPLPPLRAVEHPAPATAGWSASYVDDAGRPARWDPCTPIRFVVLPAWMPDNGRRDVVEALRRLSVTSGLVFEDGGDTDELPSRGRASYQPERYGDRWSPLLIGWVPPAATDLGLGSGVQGVSLSVAVPGENGGHLVSGQVALNADNRLSSGFGPGATEGEVLLHELAHAVGLGHVLDPTQVMYVQTTNSESEFGAGDRAGLAAVGAAAGCHPAPPASASQRTG
jgi:hypothetical protein